MVFSQRLRVFLFVCLCFLTEQLTSQTYSTNDVNYTIAKRAYDEKNWSRAAGYFEKYIEGETARSIDPSRENKLLNAYLYGAYSSENCQRYGLTIPYYERGIELARQLGKKDYLSLMLNNIGLQYQRVGKFEEAVVAHKESLQLDLEFQKLRSIGIDYSNIADAYLKWGDYAKALEYLEKSKKSHQLDLDPVKVAHREVGIGEVYLRWGQLDKAFEVCNSAAQTLLSNNYNPASAHVLMAEVYMQKENFTTAQAEMKKALEYDQRSGNDEKIASRLNILGLIYHKEKSYDVALRTFEEALANARFQKDKDQISVILSNIGTTHYDQNFFQKAIPFYEEAVGLKEELRKSAYGPIRREYLSSQIKTYKFLASCYMKTNSVSDAFHAIEAGRSKYLAEQIAGTGQQPEVISLQKTQEMLGSDDVVLMYANADWREKILIVISKENIQGMILDDKDFIRDVINLTKGKSSSETQTSRGSLNFVVDKLLAKEAAGPVPESDVFEISINYYRNFLTKQITEDKLSRLFYDLLIQPVNSDIANKKNIIISPDGLLNYLPFETLQNSKGEYLIASKNIRYTQSMGVLDVLNERNYSPNRKYMLAFGGSVYKEDSYKADMGISPNMTLPEEEFTAPSRFRYTEPAPLLQAPKDLFISETIRSELEQDQKKSIRKTYEKLGITTMNNLPGTLYEIEHIEPVVPNIKVYSKYQSTEFYVKYLDQRNELSNYKVLHFATHGLTIPVLPELSAVVLSIFKEQRGAEDGFLRTDEINKLNIKADFVNLSACETGLGKIYGGEGVVGLTQSFLIAGANGLSVSLWSVADNSTAIFMVEVYKKVNQSGMDYYEAIAETKREFIAGTHGAGFKKPFFWAPFVYYGRTLN
jgi:CHAT domain-containing protein/tetratricopeptide (TPR) repeat protein